MKQITIIDYGMSNLLSISRAFEKLNTKVAVTENPLEIIRADLLVLPGVGAFYDGMNELHKRNIPEAIHEFTKTGKPLLGICLGMQMLLTSGTEVQLTKGLNLIPGEVIPLPESSSKYQKHVIPHIGWSKVMVQHKNKLLNNNSENYMYFVHSFYANTTHLEHQLGISNFYDLPFTSMVNKDNIWGTQFHPEKSGEAGLDMLKQFITLS
ncbi:MAG: imidazole glycerol phosphate synthase subunit HisH [Bacteroidia bacterium]|jgi:glutamine amidotransferase|nr:imidazole glycerol phosphate synthase subunit HisH [Bacteroidia bacterium]